MTTETPWTGRTETVAETLESERGILDELSAYISETAVLDVGCGPGLLREHVDGRYIGADFEPEWGPDVLADAAALPFPDDAVPTVVTKTTLQHIPDWRRALQECVRVASERVVFAERTHDGLTDIVEREPVLRRRFNPAEFFGALTTIDVSMDASPLNQRVRRSAAVTSNTDDRVGIYWREL